MNNNFLDKLKSFLSDSNNIPNNISVWGYYNILSSNPDKIKSITDDCARYDFEIRFDTPNKEEYEYYTDGKLSIYFKKEDKNDDIWDRFLDFYYEISLKMSHMSAGYCQCKETDEGFNFNHKCCGKDCDWYSPFASIRKIEDHGYIEFDGYKRDLWKLENEWNSIKDETKSHALQAQLDYYEDQIKVWENAKEKFIQDNRLS